MYYTYLVDVLDADTVGIGIVLQNELLQVEEGPLVLCVLPHLPQQEARSAGVQAKLKHKTLSNCLNICSSLLD